MSGTKMWSTGASPRVRRRRGRPESTRPGRGMTSPRARRLLRPRPAVGRHARLNAGAEPAPERARLVEGAADPRLDRPEQAVEPGERRVDRAAELPLQALPAEACAAARLLGLPLDDPEPRLQLAEPALVLSELPSGDFQALAHAQTTFHDPLPSCGVS